MEFQLKPIKPFTPDMALLNCVFLSDSIYQKLKLKQDKDYPVHVKVNNIVFFAKENENCQDNQIIMNSIQRKQAGASLLGTVNVQSYQVDTSNDYFENAAQVIINPKSKPPFTEIDSDELDRKLKIDLKQRPIYVDAAIVFKYQNITFEAVLKQDSDTKNQNRNIKIITEQTQFQFQLGQLCQNMDLIGDHKQGLVLKDSPLLQFVKKSIQNLKEGHTLDDSELQLDITDIGIGGLNEQFSTIFRRLFLPRLIPAQITKQLKLQVPKGLLMYGPAGTGKTLTARKIGELLNCKSCKLVSGPEILNSYVGKSEENIRNLFLEAENDYQENGPDAGLHLIILDELDAICKQRGSKSDNTGVGDSVVNQLLAKMDGVTEVQNFIVIGMTNRRDLIDSALLRPGRFEVQMEINLPDLQGREQIFEIQLRGIKNSQFLCNDVDIRQLAQNTPNYSGAEIKGVVNGAMSYAEARMIHQQLKNEKDNIKSQLTLELTQKDLMRAIKDIEPQFGRSQSNANYQRLGWVQNIHDYVVYDAINFSKFILNSSKLNSATILIQSNYSGVGCSSIAQQISKLLNIDFVKIIDAANLIQTCSTDNAKVDKIIDVFQQAEKVQQAIIIIDSIENIIQLSGNGIRYSNIIVSTLTTLLKRLVERGKLIVIGTTNKRDTMISIDALQGWQKQYTINQIEKDQYKDIVKDLSDQIMQKLDYLGDKCPIKDLLTTVEMLKENQ